MILASICYSKPPRQCNRYRIDQQRAISETFNPEMVSQRFGPGDLQWLVQAVPMTALVCAATIALLLLLVRIVAQSLGSQHRRTRETPPTSFLVHPSLPSPFLTRDYHYPHPTPPLFHTPGPARALDFVGSSPTSYNEELPHHNMFTSFKEFSNWTTHGKFDRDSKLRGGVESGTL